MKICIVLAVLATCALAGKRAKCGRFRKVWEKCLADGYVQRNCGDDTTESENTPNLKGCKKAERKLTKNCGLKCPSVPTEAPATCWDGLQKDYRGDISTTITGFTCMVWTDQSPHTHSRTEANYPGSGVGDHNYCRNPDNEPEGAWCYTTDPNQRWDYCHVPKCTGQVSCWDELQKDYRGPLQVTESGEPCQKWTEQSPHGHSRTPANYPDTGLGDHNYCRNPDNEEGGAWCYTTNPNQRWDFCGVPRCLDSEKYCWDGLQKTYRGPKTTTATGKKCQKWTEQAPHEHIRTEENYPDEGLGDHNYCRNPDNEPGGSWCYTVDSAERWDYCGVKKCNDCYDGLQKTYRGKKATTNTGKTCMNWRKQDPHSHVRTEANYPLTGLGDHNYCRNPDNEPEGAWCYTTDPESRWEYCGIAKCTA